MDKIVSVGFIFICILIGVIYWYRKRIQSLSEDLSFFKKEKEYHSEGMMVLSSDYTVIFANQSAKSLFSLDDKYQTKTHHRNIQLRIDTNDTKDFFEALKYESEKKVDSFHLKNVWLLISDKMKQVNIYVDKSVWNREKTITCIIDFQTLTSTSTASTQKDGGIDFFTGFPSQFSALTDINSSIMKSQDSSESFALFLFGIDYFKELQTTFGLGFSNQIIREIANYFKTKNGTGIHVYRMDCDKFLIVVEKISGDEDIREKAKNMILDIKNLNTKESPVNISSSVGIVKYPQDGENALKLINHVYTALSQAEKESTSNIEFFTTEYQSYNKDTAKMAEEIRNALKNNEFILYYQPIFSLKNENMVGAEALIRWKHPELGVITADKFLDIAKQTGLMVDVGEYVFKKAILQRKQWNTFGLQTFKITLNLSLEEIQVDTLIKKLKTLFEQNNVNPKDFNLDIRENATLINAEKTAMDFKLFTELGLSISLDHFASEYTSLKHLQSLPINTVKIDRTLIFDVVSNFEHQKIVKAIIILAHSLDIEVVATGVETSKELSLLHAFGCDYAQGYLYAKPLSADEFQELLA